MTVKVFYENFHYKENEWSSPLSMTIDLNNVVSIKPCNFSNTDFLNALDELSGKRPVSPKGRLSLAVMIEQMDMFLHFTEKDLKRGGRPLLEICFKQGGRHIFPPNSQIDFYEEV